MIKITGDTTGKYHFTIDGEKFKFKFYNVSESSLKGNLVGLWSESLFNKQWKEGEINIEDLEIHKRQYFGHWGSMFSKERWYLEFIYQDNTLTTPVIRRDEDLNKLMTEIEKVKSKLESIKENIRLEKEEKRLGELNVSKKTYIKEFDNDGNGVLDIVEKEVGFNELVKKHQNKIVEIDKKYLQEFIKISFYQKQKKNNLQSIFENINDVKNQDELSRQYDLLKEQIHSYELLIFHSFNMLTSLIEEDMFTFYEIYESFDKLGIFNSNHENEVSERLRNIEGGIYELMKSIQSMEERIVSELGYLSYMNQINNTRLLNSVQSQLESIGSSLKFNNLLTSINTYQSFRVNQNTRTLRR